MVHAGWDFPPSEFEWEPRPELAASLAKATQLVEDSAVHQRWGWKDPRNSLTLPFWLRLIPNLKVIICLRNPLEVARSLSVRNGTSLAFGLNLWRSYNLAVCSFVAQQDRLVTHYEAYFLIRAASCDGSWIFEYSGLRHRNRPGLFDGNFRFTTSQDSWELLAAQSSPQITELYSELCAEAGPVFQASLG